MPARRGVSLNQCARRPLDFVARYGGEEFAVVLYEASREYVAEVLTESSAPSRSSTFLTKRRGWRRRLTVSIGAAFVLPTASRTPTD
jgi:diguanylate cyclase (GGDEF)-like protein